MSADALEQPNKVRWWERAIAAWFGVAVIRGANELTPPWSWIGLVVGVVALILAAGLAEVVVRAVRLHRWGDCNS